MSDTTVEAGGYEAVAHHRRYHHPKLRSQPSLPSMRQIRSRSVPRLIV
jgi:hypothetical protein